MKYGACQTTGVRSPAPPVTEDVRKLAGNLRDSAVNVSPLATTQRLSAVTTDRKKWIVPLKPLCYPKDTVVSMVFFKSHNFGISLMNKMIYTKTTAVGIRADGSLTARGRRLEGILRQIWLEIGWQ